MVVSADAPAEVAVGPGSRASRTPRTWDFVRLRLRLMGNGLRGQTWRKVAFGVGVAVGLWFAALGFLGLLVSSQAGRNLSFVVAVFAGSAAVLGWALIPLLFFGVDETLDPARFALLPVTNRTLARGMLAAALVGVPATATLLASLGLVLGTGLRDGVLPAVAALLGVVGGLLLGVVASRAVTSAFASMLRSRRVRDLAAVLIAVLASSIGPLQLLGISTFEHGNLDQAVRVARILGWTPLGAGYAMPFDVAAGRWVPALGRLVIVWTAIVLLLWWWSSTLESAMIGVAASGPTRSSSVSATGPVASLIPGLLRRVTPATAFGAILSRESRSWWRDARRRASLVSVMMASIVLPIALKVAGTSAATGRPSVPLGFAVTMAGTMGGMLLANQFALDGSAFAAHLLTCLPGKVELRARATALAVVALPVLLLVTLGVTAVGGTPARTPAGIGILAAGFGSAVGAASILSVLAAYPIPESSNPFALNSGGGSAKGLLALIAMIATLVISSPVVLAGTFLTSAWGAWLVLLLGIGYGLAVAAAGTLIGGRVLDSRGPELLIAVTPRR